MTATSQNTRRAALETRIEALRTGIVAAEAKRARIASAILSRRKHLSQLEAQLVLLQGQPGPVPTHVH